MKKIGIEEVSGWILRLGVAASALIMVLGAALSFAHHNVALERMKHEAFDANPGDLLRGIGELRGQYVIELGVYVLLATPITRVAASVLLFHFSEHDRFYAFVTAMVLLMTLAGLLLIR